jgi:hypothetical protein
MDLDAYCGLDTGMLVMNLIWKIALKNGTPWYWDIRDVCYASDVRDVNSVRAVCEVHDSLDDICQILCSWLYPRPPQQKEIRMPYGGGGEAGKVGRGDKAKDII